MPREELPRSGRQKEKKDKDMEMIEEKKEWLKESRLNFFFLSAVAEPDDSERTHYCCQQLEGEDLSLSCA